MVVASLINSLQTRLLTVYLDIVDEERANPGVVTHRKKNPGREVHVERRITWVYD
jgi:hypothetical protein